MIPYLLYGSPRSGSCSVELAFAAIGADYARCEVDIRADAQRDAAYAATARKRQRVRVHSEPTTAGFLDPTHLHTS